MTTAHSALVVGSESAVGRQLLERAAAYGVGAIGTSRRSATTRPHVHLDLAAPDMSRVPDVEWAFLCAAVTSIPECERDPERARAINVQGIVSLGQHLVSRGTRVIFLSTNMVFDGARPHRRVDEPPSPSTVYGRHKAEAEKALLELGPLVSIVRLTKVISPTHTLLAAWAKALSEGSPIHPFSNLILAPTALDQTVELLYTIGARNAPGVFHLSGDRDLSYAELGYLLAVGVGADARLVQPVVGPTPPDGTPRRHTTLDTSSLDQLGMTAWSSERTVRSVVANLRGATSITA